MHLLTQELFGRDLDLGELPRRSDVVGIGLSDAANYAGPLAGRLGYTNTYFDSEPRLDIAALPPAAEGTCDFVVASDVFEHVAPPVSRAFVNARRLLKPGAVLVLTVPFTLEGDTVEHFPELHDYRLLDTPGGRVLENRTRDGRTQVFSGLRFHGGPGSTLEMRVFSRAGLERELAAAGFSRVRIADEACPAHGICWPDGRSVPIVAHA